MSLDEHMAILKDLVAKRSALQAESAAHTEWNANLAEIHRLIYRTEREIIDHAVAIAGFR